MDLVGGSLASCWWSPVTPAGPVKWQVTGFRDTHSWLGVPVSTLTICETSGKLFHLYAPYRIGDNRTHINTLVSIK